MSSSPGTQQQTSIEPRTRPREVPLYHVVLLDDNEHTYDYVIEMLCNLFRVGLERAFQLACEVDVRGRVVVETCVLELAELKRDQIHGYGADWRIARCKGSMSAVLERANG